MRMSGKIYFYPSSLDASALRLAIAHVTQWPSRAQAEAARRMGSGAPDILVPQVAAVEEAPQVAPRYAGVQLASGRQRAGRRSADLHPNLPGLSVPLRADTGPHIQCAHLWTASLPAPVMLARADTLHLTERAQLSAHARLLRLHLVRDHRRPWIKSTNICHTVTLQT